MRGEQGIKDALIQNLKDAGCGKNLIDEFMELFNEQEKSKILKLLENYRNILIKKLHKDEKQVDNLDYLILDLKNNNYMKGVIKNE